MMNTQALAHIVSLAKEQKQEELKPDQTRQCGINFDSKLTVTIKRRHVSSVPSNIEQLRCKYAGLSNLWLSVKVRQPGRSMYSDRDEATFSKFLDNLID